MMQPAGYLAFSLHGENGSHHTVANRGNYLRRPRPLLPPSCGRGVGSPKAGPPAWAQAPAPLAFPRTLFSSCLLPTTVDFPSLQNYGSGDRNDPPGLAPPFIHCPTFFFFFGSSSQPNFLESVYTSCFHFLTCRSLSSPFRPGFHSANST